MVTCKTRKRGNGEYIATRGRPTLPQSFPALITTPCQVWSRWTYLLPYYSVSAADTLLCAMTLTFYILPWTFAMYRLWGDKILYQIWTQSITPRRSYCDFYRAAWNADAVLRWEFRPSVRLSIRQTRELWQNGRKICLDFYTIRKMIYPSFMRKRMIGGGRPLLPEILGQPARVGAKSPILNR